MLWVGRFELQTRLFLGIRESGRAFCATKFLSTGHPGERDAGFTKAVRRYLATNFAMQFGEQRPVESASHVMGCVIAEVASQDVVPPVLDVERGLKVVVGMQSRMVVVGVPACDVKRNSHG